MIYSRSTITFYCCIYALMFRPSTITNRSFLVHPRFAIPCDTCYLSVMLCETSYSNSRYLALSYIFANVTALSHPIPWSFPQKLLCGKSCHTKVPQPPCPPCLFASRRVLDA